VPSTVQAMLAERIDRLLPEDKRLLRVAAVVGKDVPFTLLHAIAELSDEALRGGLERLQAAEFVYETGPVPDLDYTFKHALIHEVAYGGLLHGRRRELHGRAVAEIERIHATRLDEQIERLAHHSLHAGLMDKAVSYQRRAGSRAFERSANREAVMWFEQALTVLQQLPQDRTTIEQGIDLRIGLRDALMQLSEWDRVRDYLFEAQMLARNLGDRRREGWVASHLINYYVNTGDPVRAIELVAHCHLGLGKLHRRPGDHGQTQEHLIKATAMYREMDMAYWLQQAAAEMGGPSASSVCTSAQHGNSNEASEI
jgi:hypothetical protein